MPFKSVILLTLLFRLYTLTFISQIIFNRVLRIFFCCNLIFIFPGITCRSCHRQAIKSEDKFFLNFLYRLNKSHSSSYRLITVPRLSLDEFSRIYASISEYSDKINFIFAQVPFSSYSRAQTSTLSECKFRCCRDPEEVAADLLRHRDQPDQDTNATI